MREQIQATRWRSGDLLAILIRPPSLRRPDLFCERKNLQEECGSLLPITYRNPAPGRRFIRCETPGRSI
jgi:hypothetical protein